jgi:hypothetical protein
MDRAGLNIVRLRLSCCGRKMSLEEQEKVGRDAYPSARALNPSFATSDSSRTLTPLAGLPLLESSTTGYLARQRVQPCRG